MSPPSRFTWAYIGSIACLGLIACLSTIPAIRWGDLDSLILAGGGALLLLVTETHQVPVSPKANVSISGAVLFALLLLLGPGLASWVAVIGMGLAYLYLRRRWYNVLFNAWACALTVVSSGLVYHLVGNGTKPTLSSLTVLAALLMAGVVFFGLDTALVAGIISLRERCSWPDTWLKICGRSAGEYAAMLSLGVLAAVAYQAAWWAVIFIILPLWILYRSLRLATHSV